MNAVVTPPPPAPPSSLQDAKDVAAIVQAIATVIAVLVGAAWFVRKEQNAPHANIKHEVQSLQLTPQWQWVRLGIVFDNVGEVPIRLSTGKTYIQRVLPLESVLDAQLTRGETIIQAEAQTVAWPMIGQPYDIQVEAIVGPKESERYEFDFIVPSTLCVVSLYSHLANAERQPLGWSLSTLHRIEGCANAN